MRRRLNCAYLAQYFLMLLLIALLVYLVWRGAPAYAFILAFLTGIVLAAMPGFYSGYILPRREHRRAERIRKQGIPTRARVLRDGAEVLAEFHRSTLSYKGVSLILDVPIGLLSPETRDGEASMKADKDALAELKSGTLVGVRIDPDDREYIVLDEVIGQD